MAATLTWKERIWSGGRLMLGGWQVAAVWREGAAAAGAGEFHYELQNEDCTHGGPYQDGEDAFQDCESEVRRLLRDAGVTLAD
jgi:hypothetical protein